MMKHETVQRVQFSPAEDYPAAAPSRVRRAALLHRWSELSFVHWPYEPADVQALLPAPLEVDTSGGVAWVGLVPFHCTIRPPWAPRLPWVSSFEEMNVRTYVRGPGGVPGVWFITLDAARLGAVLVARARWGLEYFWSKMAFSRIGDVVTYSCRRRWPPSSEAMGTLAVQLGERIDAEDMTALDGFLTGRWTFYGELRGRLYRGQIEHEPWPLRRAGLLHCDPGLVAACGLPAPEGEPIVHYAEAVDVRMSGRERLVRVSSSARPRRRMSQKQPGYRGD